MGGGCHGTKSIWLQVSIVTILTIHVVAAPENLLNTRRIRHVKPFKNLTKPVKTIQIENGDILDCVDIYKQPAFDHPALKNHSIQMRPSKYIKKMKMASNASSFRGLPSQLSPTNESCPEGTVPILRTRNNDLVAQKSETFANTVSQVSGSGHIGNMLNTNTHRSQYQVLINDLNAKLILNAGTYYGATALLNVWNVSVQPGEASSSLIVLGDGDNLIYAGLTVSDLLYEDKLTRFTIYWTADDSRATGCYNLNCPGFVQTSSTIHLGGLFRDTSVYGADVQINFDLDIYLDQSSKNWWLRYQDEQVGYWPASIFNNNFLAANTINWGGEVRLSSTPYCSGRTDLGHSSTQMGNGHYPAEGGFGISSYVFNALYWDRNGEARVPDGGYFYADNPYCYDFKNKGTHYGDKHYPGISFFFGGDGQQRGCF